MNKILVLLVAIGLTACGPEEINRVAHPETERLQPSTEYCSKGSGYCYACGMGFDGFKCSMAFKYNCPGNRAVTNKVWDVTVNYDDGTKRETYSSERVSIDGTCK